MFRPLYGGEIAKAKSVQYRPHRHVAVMYIAGVGFRRMISFGDVHFMINMLVTVCGIYTQITVPAGISKK